MSNNEKGDVFLLNATSADIDHNGKTYVVLYWTAVRSEPTSDTKPLAQPENGRCR